MKNKGSNSFLFKNYNNPLFFWIAVVLSAALFFSMVFTCNQGVSVVFGKEIKNNQETNKKNQEIPASPLIGSANGGPDIVTYVGIPTVFNGQAISPDALVMKYQWDFDGNGKADWESSTTGLTTNIFSKSGKYKAVFKASDENGTEFPLGIIRVVVRERKGEEEPVYIPKGNLQRSNQQKIKKDREAFKEKLDLSSAEEDFLELEINSIPSQNSVSPGAYSMLGTSLPPDGVKKSYAVMINGASETRFWDDVTYSYDMFRDIYFIPESDIYLLNYNGLNPNGQNPNNMIDYAATRSNLQSVFGILANLIDGDDTLYVWITDHGQGYTGSIQRVSSQQPLYGYLDGRASVDPGDERDYLERDFKLRSLFTGGDYEYNNHGMEVWKTYKSYKTYSQTYYYRHKYVSHFNGVYFTQLGLKSDNDIYIEEFRDYLRGDYNRDGIIDTSLGEVFDADGDGIQPYNPATQSFDEGDWGEIDTYVDNIRTINTQVPESFSYTYYILDINLDNHLDIDLNHDPANPEANGTDLDNNGLFDGVDVNDDKDMDDWVSIDEKFVLYGDGVTDDDLRNYLQPINARAIVVMMEPCFSGGFIEDLSRVNTIVMTATEEETVSWGNRFIRNISRALTGLTYSDSAGNPSSVDANHDGHKDLAEVFNFAAANDYGSYIEIPQYDDDGDGISHPFPLPNGNDGNFGTTVYPVPITPLVGSIKINNDSVYANSTSVTLNLSAIDTVTQMQFSNDHTSFSDLEPYAPTKSWVLTSGDGLKTVYVKFADINGFSLGDYSDTIVLDTIPPAISAVSSSSITYSAATISWTTDELSDTQIEYGATTSYESSTTPDTGLVTSHSQNLSGLIASTLYHYRVKSRDAAGNPAISEDNTFTALPAPDPLASAVDNMNLIFTTGGNVNWFSENSEYYYGDSAVQSGAIGNNQSTYMQTNVVGNRTLKFYWKVSSQSGGDYLNFYIDGKLQASISGITGTWTQKIYPIASGVHTLTWIYAKDKKTVKGKDAGWIDKIEYIE